MATTAAWSGLRATSATQAWSLKAKLSRVSCRMTVAVEISDGHCVPFGAGRIDDMPCERSFARVQHHRNVTAVGVRDDQIRFAVAVKVSARPGLRALTGHVLRCIRKGWTSRM